MVERIGNGPGYGYPQVNEKKANTGTGEKFKLDYGKEGAIYEPSSETKKKQTIETSAESKLEERGVKLTLSSEYSEEKSSASKAETQENGVFDVLTKIVGDVFDKVKQFFLSIWNEEPKAETQVPKVEEPKTQFEKAKAEAEAFLSSAEGKKAARNSDLLTYYDKHGSVINVSPSDRQRILYGDKNQIEV